MATMKDIAKAAKVSVATVSNVLNNKSNVSEETRELILDLCQKMNYQPNMIARSLKAGKTNTVLFSFSDFERSFYLKVIHGINDCLLAYNIGLIISAHTTVANLLNSGLVDGAIILDKSVKDEQMLSAAKKTKMVTMDRSLDPALISSVLTDNATSMKALMAGLINRGYKHFHFVGGPVHTLDHIERYHSFQEILKENNIPFTQDQYFQGDYSAKSGRLAGNLMVMGKNLPEVVVCANDNMAAGVIESFEKSGLTIPEDGAVTGFDGDPLITLPKDYLTTALIPRYEMGYLAAETLVAMIREESPPVIRKVNAPVFWGKSTI